MGHGLEGDFNRRGTSVFSGQVGSWWLQTCVPWLMMARWSIAVVRWRLMTRYAGEYNVLIENGILKGYMQDNLRAFDGDDADARLPRLVRSSAHAVYDQHLYAAG
ncbi:hypothetical protein ACNKHM_15850 [Shigella sonnei]